MSSSNALTCAFAAAAFLLATHEPAAAQIETGELGSSYKQLTDLFVEWRAFQVPPLVDDVYDYSREAMSRQQVGLAKYLQRLSRIDTTRWSVSMRIDYHLVLSEMNGLDFDLRIRQPWARDPAFYVMIFPSQTDVVPREGPVIPNAIELWEYERPFSDETAAALSGRIDKIPIQLDYAMHTLSGNARDLWLAGIRSMREQEQNLVELAREAGGSSPSLAASIHRAIDATETFVVWLESEAPKKTGPSGVGADNYTWYLQKVHLVPYSWEEQVVLVRRELDRAISSLRLEEHRNRNLPEIGAIDSEQEYSRRMRAAVDEYLIFLDRNEILTVEDYMRSALMDRIGAFSSEPLSFFSEVNYREPLIMRTHHHHWLDIARMREAPHESSIRSTPLLSNIYDSRAEGLATGMEEMMMHAGLLDDLPRARELVWIMLAQRSARALAALRMHANEFTMQQAVDFASAWTPRGWLAADGSLAWHEQHLYLQQPGYGTSYVIGKLEIERLLAEFSREVGRDFELKPFMDALNGAGVIPVSLIRWEMTGQDDDIRRMHGD